MARRFVESLEQMVTWTGQDGRTYYIGELDDEHLGNIIAYLNRHAERLLQARRDLDEFELLPRSADHVRYLESVDALTWLHDRPLYQRLLAEQRRRASVDGDVVPNASEIEASRGLD